MALLSSEFLSRYVGINPRNAGTLFFPVYCRTYQRYVPELRRRETWAETIERVVNYSVGLYSGPKSQEDLVDEAEFMFDDLFHLNSYPAGRSYWIAGTKAVEKFPEASFNCTMMVIDRLEAFSDLFHLLLLGCGVGFRVLKEDVLNLPQFITNFEIINDAYEPVEASKRLEKTEVYEFNHSEDEHYIEIGDSREGWVEALRSYLRLLTIPQDPELTRTIIFDYNNIRPSGERIKSFGGRAPGPNGLKEMFNDLTKILQGSTGRLTPTRTMDVCNIVAKNVLVGGVRRSSQIALGSEDDSEFMDAKLDLFTNEDKKDKKHRIMSNNSLVFTKKPSKEHLTKIFGRIKESWEPGFLNQEAAEKRRPWFAAINPCGEALGADKGNCNLTGVVLTSHVVDKAINWESLEKSIRLSTRVGLRQTNITWSLPEWDEVHKRDRLLGVSLTGIMDALDELEWEFDDENSIRLWKFLNWAANDEADKYSFEMRVPRPLLVCILKPEGSISQLPTVSSGLHRSFAPHYIRRIRVSSLDPVCKALRELGVPNEPDVNKGERIVFSFPIKTNAKKSAYSESALRQYQRYLTLMENFVDHNASITISVGDGEWEEIVDAVYENWDKTVACAFANKDNSQYPQLPYEEISKEEYELRMQGFPNLNHLDELVNKYENAHEEYEIIEDACAAGGVCPLR